MSNIELIQGHTLEKLKDIPSESIDLIVADPPYNLGKNYGNGHEIKGFEEYVDFSEKWLTEAKRILKKTGTIYVFMGFRFISYLYNILDRNLNFNFNTWITWHYTQGLGKKKGFSPRHDDILMFTKSDDYKFNLNDIRIPQKYYRARNNMRGANPGDVWQFSHIHYCNENRQEHPTQKPEGLIERMVLCSSDKGDLVLDPFAGSGTTLRVCQQLGRDCIGIELNQKYIQMIKKRLDEPFKGFDSIDPRMERVPMDLRDNEIRKKYVQSHIKWFLNHHNGSVDDFIEKVKIMYGKNSKNQSDLSSFK